MNYNSKQIDILNVSLKLFAEKGFDGTSIRDIAKAADINVAMVSYYFGSKEKLLEAIIIYRVSDFRMILENLQTELISPIEKIKKFVSFYVNMLFQNKDFYQLVHFEMVNQKRACDFSAFSEIKKKNLKLLQNIIEEGQKDGEFKSNCNSLLIPALVIGTFSQIYNNKKFYIEMLNLKDDKAFENYMLNTFKEDITNVVLGMLIK
ncbi:Probable transcriptional regulator, TetR family [Flavobacterium indicum GPTSA100-9 = DSM 17447]|uniref:Probable transcriptional regulator, TetR family n=1 Tax=Flavobacterium indicum (strain DSM 17447 / CIP 109464 / GPTSA100-9) TaxID=1094466 RepID=H8XQW0_FLAIG|nr:TetR family transcriptional regulator [Flavobacterium indicum]CCG53408.1 Probable transcriptional regulator, TetR family [Flavobacterium indicum GPTSA100-9 = DSM 17447]